MNKLFAGIALLALSGAAQAGESTNAAFGRLDTDQDGWLTAAEFAAAKSERSFASLDVNKDGKLDPAEFAASARKEEQPGKP